jgi:hypothetical protein
VTGDGGAGPGRVSTCPGRTSPDRSWKLTDRLDGQRLERDGDALEADHLYVGLEPWRPHSLALCG